YVNAAANSLKLERSKFNAGTIDSAGRGVSIDGGLEVIDGSSISTQTAGAGASGAINVRLSGSLLIDAQGSADRTGLLSGPLEDTTGAGGNISIVGQGTIDVLNGGGIAAGTPATGRAGNITIDTGQDKSAYVFLDGGGAGL